ncbi:MULTISPECIES: CsbD family protein [Xanthomonas]|uniref:CsbD family protein n=1 Tax=Xanthomonas TaxID=338 RepID=UPI00069931C8|nr:CsbD family protein [Xanthomonas campestris]MCC5045603.1 CsbD family protein [Xanthomonas campestris]
MRSAAHCRRFCTPASVKEAIGRVTGDKSTELEGAAEKNIGKVQRKAGELADDVRDATKSTR